MRGTFGPYHRQCDRRSALAAMLAGCALPAKSQSSLATLRFGLCESLAADVNISDARAAMLVWLKRIGTDLRLNLMYPPQVFEAFPRIAAQLRQGSLDAAALTIFEYRQVAEWLHPNEFIVAARQGESGYVVLAQADSEVSSLAQLRGRRLVLTNNLSCSLAPAWLSNLLQGEGWETADRHFLSVKKVPKSSQAILPVFFGQAEACLVTNHSFLTMGELNPQVPRRLRVIASSPPVVTVVYGFHRALSPQTIGQTRQALAAVPGSAAGRQVLTMFQSDRLEMVGAGRLASSLAILDEAERRERGQEVRRKGKGA